MRLNYLEAVMRSKQVTREELAKAVDMNYVTLSKRLTGSIDLKLSEIRSITDYLKLNDEEIKLCFFRQESFQKETN